MKSRLQAVKFPAGLVFALFSGALTLLSLTALLLLLISVFRSGEAGSDNFISIVTGSWQMLVFAVLLLTAIASLLGFFFGNIIGAPLRRAVMDLENLHSLESNRKQTAEAVAELQVLSEACRKLSDSLEIRSQHSEETLAEAAHTLKAPLARQRLQLELLKRKNGISPEIESMERDVENMHDIIHRTLDYVRCGAVENFTLCLIDPLPVFKEAIEKNQPLAIEKGQNLKTAFPSLKVSINADANNLSQVLDEMLFNAIRYTPSGGTIEAAISESSDSIILSVSDNGPGAEESELSRIFEPFYRGEAVRASDAAGSGMGLALASRYCSNMQADIKARRRPEGGLCVSVEFPKN